MPTLAECLTLSANPDVNLNDFGCCLVLCDNDHATSYAGCDACCGVGCAQAGRQYEGCTACYVQNTLFRPFFVEPVTLFEAMIIVAIAVVVSYLLMRKELRKRDGKVKEN